MTTTTAPTSSQSKYDQTLHETDSLIYKTYPGEPMLVPIMDIMKEELSEPYPIYTYRHFINGWPDATIITYDKDNNNKFIACIVGNVEIKDNRPKGYIAMLAVDKSYRKRGIGKQLVELLIHVFKKEYNVDEVYLETETSNVAALGLYESLGFIRTKLFMNYYLNTNSAYRLKLFIDRDDENSTDTTEHKTNSSDKE